MKPRLPCSALDVGTYAPVQKRAPDLDISARFVRLSAVLFITTSPPEGRVRSPREARERPHAEPPRGPVVRARGQPAQLPRRGRRAGPGGGRRLGHGQRMRVRARVWVHRRVVRFTGAWS